MYSNKNRDTPKPGGYIGTEVVDDKKRPSDVSE